MQTEAERYKNHRKVENQCNQCENKIGFCEDCINIKGKKYLGINCKARGITNAKFGAQSCDKFSLKIDNAGERKPISNYEYYKKTDMLAWCSRRERAL